MTQLIAPNGKPSNLTPEQWKLVRTPQFKAWFGDWENDPENASKVVDENGEPLVVYHGSKQSINIFKKKKNTKQDNPNYVQGFWFFSAPIGNSLTQEDREYFYDEGSAEWMAENWVVNSEGDSIAKVIRCFLNVRNPIEVDSYAEFLHWRNDNDVLNSIKNNERDGWFIHGSTTDGGLFRDDINVFNSNQIKLADGTNTTFDGSNPDIRFAEGGMISNVQQGDALIYKDSEFLDFDSVIYVEGVTENANGTLVSLSNGQRMFLPQVAEKFRIATPSEMNRSEIMGKELFSKGGNTKRTMKRIKRGGITYGKSHAEGGIPVKNQSTGDMLEVEGGEGIVNKRSMASKSIVTLNGKKMNICQAVSELNQMEGGVKFSCEDVNDRQFIKAMAKGGELDRGTRTEQEHIQVLKDLYAKRITPKQASERIAKDHLKEDSRYYSKLAKMEGKMAKGGKTKIDAPLEFYDWVKFSNGDVFQVRGIEKDEITLVSNSSDGGNVKFSDIEKMLKSGQLKIVKVNFEPSDKEIEFAEEIGFTNVEKGKIWKFQYEINKLKHWGNITTNKETNSIILSRNHEYVTPSGINSSGYKRNFESYMSALQFNDEITQKKKLEAKEKMADGGKTRKNAKKTLSEAVGFDINSIDISKL